MMRRSLEDDFVTANGHRRWTAVLPSLTATLLAVSPVWSADAPTEPTTYDYRQITLENGLRVITLEDHSCPIVSVQIWYHVGSKDEDPQRQGFAHMFEHMMFRGTDRLGPTDHFDLIRRTGGTTNGYTNFDSTTYLETLPSNQLELALWLEAERMALLRIDQESFLTERKVVEEERRMGLNRPFGTLMENMMAQMFKVHPYQWTPIGNIPHLRAAKVQELRDFWDRYYVPNNATLVIVGDIQHEMAQQLARKYLGWIPRADDPDRVTVREPLPTESREVTIREQNAPVPVVMVAYRTVPIANEDTVPLDLLSTILAGGQSSRLYRELVAEKQLAVAAQAMRLSLEQDGVLGLMAVLSPTGSQPDEVLEVITQHVDRVRREAVSPEELTKAKNQQLAQLVTQNLTIDSKARAVGYAAVVEGDVSRVNRQIDDVRRVATEDLQRVAQTYLVPDKSMVIRVPRNLLGSAVGKLRSALGTGEDAASEDEPATEGSDTAEDQAVASDPSEDSQPSLQRPEGFPSDPPLAGLLESNPRLEHSQDELSNGLEVIVVPNHEVPFVSIRLQLLAGSFTEQKIGAASMAMQMLDKGTAAHTEAELAEELDRYAISLSGSAGSDSASVSAGCLTDLLDRAIGLLSEVARTPTFPAEEFEKLRAQVRAELAVQSAEPSYIASRELDRQLFGQHPYSRTSTGELADVDALTLSDLQQWWQQFVRPDMAVLILAGDIDQPSAMELAQKAFGDWQAEGARPETQLPEFPEPQSTRILLVDRPGSVQSQIRVGQLGFTRHDPAYFTSVLVSDYFGGAFDSRLNEAVRVEKGLTYGARGGYQSYRYGGAFIASTFTKTESTADALQIVLDEIEQLGDVPPGPDELKKRQTYFLGSFAMRRETPQQLAGDLWLIESNDLPPNHFEAMLDAIRATSPADCQSLARDSLDPEKLTIVVVGDAAKLQQDLEKIAPVSVIKTSAERKEPGRERS